MVWISPSQFPILHGKYLYYREYTALFGCICCIFCFFLFLIPKFLIGHYILPKFKQKPDQTRKHSESNELLPLTMVEDPKAPEPEPPQETFKEDKFLTHRTRWIKAYSVLTYLAWLALASNFIILSAFSILPFLLCLPFSTVIVLIAYADTSSLEEKPKKSKSTKNKKPAQRSWLPNSKFLRNLFWTCWGLKLLAYLLTYKSCLIDHVSVGIPILIFSYTSAFTRFFTLPKACPPGPPCHVFMTLPFETSKSAFVNVHTHIGVEDIEVEYTLKRDVDNGIKKSFKAVDQRRIFPNEFDYTGERYVHTALIDDLEPEEMYQVTISYHGEVQRTFLYKSLPDENSKSSYNVIYTGDVGYSKDAEIMAEVIAKQDPVSIFIGGDIAYDNGDPSCSYAMDLFLSVVENQIYSTLGRVVPMIVAIGNHDIGSNNMNERTAQLTENFPTILNYFPQELVSYHNYTEVPEIPEIENRNSFTAHKIGRVVNFVLDSGYMANFECPQTYWFTKMIEKHMNYTKIAVYHDPMFSLFANFTETGKNDVLGAEIWVPLLEKYNFKAGFEHHVHAFKRTYPIRDGKIDPTGVVYFGDGCWGVEPTHSDESRIRPEIKALYEKYSKKNNIWVANFDQGKNKITYTAFGLDGNMLDDPYVQDF